jgi:hypothetical protein
VKLALGRTFYSSRPGDLYSSPPGPFGGYARGGSRVVLASDGNAQWIAGKFAGSYRNFAIPTVIQLVDRPELNPLV